MEHPARYKGKEIVVLGLARSGIAVAKLFHEIGAKVIVNDQKNREQCPEADELEALGIAVICGGHPAAIFHPHVALLIKNPGIPYEAPPVKEAIRAGIEIVSEVEVAYYISPAAMIGITGSNGKTTTTTWIYNIFAAAGRSPLVAGNIGRALCEAAAEATASNVLIVELSSFQLKGTVHFRPLIACLLNVYETHMDYHSNMEDYIASKAKLFANQTAEDTAVINWDDPICRSVAEGARAAIFPFSMSETLEKGVYLDSLDGVESIVYADGSGAARIIIAVSQLNVRGRYNVENALAAASVALVAGIEIAVIAEQLQQFNGVEHRLEYVAMKNDISFYNNSKATNPAAAAKAIEAFEGNVVLIAGGMERKAEFSGLLYVLQQKVKAVVAIGETRVKISQVAAQAGIRKIDSVDNATNAAETMQQAVKAAYAFAAPGDVVLLSPACASWDMFTSYEQRGRIFKEAVHNLK